MASLSLTQPLTTSTIATTTSKTSLCPSFRNTSQTRSSAKRKSKALSRRPSISCKAREGDDRQNPANNSSDGFGKLDRRNMLLGLGGLYGTVGGLRSDPFAIADPLLAPDLSKCKTPSGLPAGVVTECCPPFTDQIIDFRPPRTPLRVRQAAHCVDSEYIAKYNEATKRMKELPADDPRNFMQQANVHCAYCNGAYDQVDHPELVLQIHNSWHFFPFHRWYLYFYEKILGKLIDDPTFALPFWNWDHPSGMQMPAFFTNKSSALYDEKRSNKNQPPSIVDLNFPPKKDASPKSYNQQVQENLAVMYQSMVSGAKLPLLFFGDPYLQGSEKAAAGTIERTPHTAIHVWGGSEKDREKNGEDIGNFYSAGRDPLFYCHHANVDRMWSLWKTIGKKRRDISDPDFLEATYLFYDENARLVRVKVRDCLDTKKLGYVYDDVEIPWLYKKPRPHKSKLVKMLTQLGVAKAADTKRVALADFPITLTGSVVTTVVPRPTKGRSKEEKEEEEEVLEIEGIDFDKELAVKFDVYVNDEDAVGADKSEFAGSFGNVPHKLKPGADHSKVSLKLGISDLLDDVGADDDENIVVALVPKNDYPVTIGGMKIELVS